MHQLLIIALFIGLFAFDESAQPVFVVHERTVSLSVVVGFSAIAAGLVLTGMIARIQISRRMLLAAPRWFFRLIRLAPMLVLLWYLGTLSMGWVPALKAQFGGLWILPEIAILTPPLTLICLTHVIMVWVRQKTSAVYLKQHPAATESVENDLPLLESLVVYIRQNIAVIAGPLLLITGWQSLIHNQFTHGSMTPFTAYANVVSIVGTLAIIVTAPLLIIRIWDTIPLPQGPLHEMLHGMCRQYRVKVAEIRVWQTRKTMTNAAVLGVTGRFRFILLSDQLLEKFSPVQIQAVMAHEIAHIRLKHMPWLLCTGFSLLVVGATVADLAIRATVPAIVSASQSWTDLHTEIQDLSNNETFLVAAGLTLVMAFWVPTFGWVARRFERQADTFAVEHMAAQRLDTTVVDHSADTGPQSAKDRTQAPLIDGPDKDLMISTLDRIAELNAIPHRRPSWWHGSIQFRTDYLQTLEGQPIGAARVHRIIALIKVAAILILTAAALAEIGAGYFFAVQTGASPSAVSTAAATSCTP